MPHFLVHHHHDADDCGVAFASFRGFSSPLRGRTTLTSCRSGGHEVWWLVPGPDEAAAYRLLPHYVAARSTVTRVDRVAVP